MSVIPFPRLYCDPVIERSEEAPSLRIPYWANRSPARVEETAEPTGTDCFLDPADRDFSAAYAARRRNNPTPPDDFPPAAA